MTQKMLGKDIVEKITEEIKRDLVILKKEALTPSLAIVRLGEDAGSIAYEKSLKKQFLRLSLNVKTYSFSKEIDEDEFLEKFEEINQNNDIHGILVLRPLPAHIDTYKVAQKINPYKDVDGMSPTNLGKIMLNDKEGLISATPAAVMRLLEFYDVDLEGKDVVIIGHSEVVGKPLSILLLNKNATVTVTHIHSKNTKEMAKKADILITATGVAGLVTEEYVKTEAVVIDVGISKVNHKIAGDVDYKGIAKKVSKITPVPGGVGAVTTVMLASHLIKATKLLLKKNQI